MNTALRQLRSVFRNSPSVGIPAEPTQDRPNGPAADSAASVAGSGRAASGSTVSADRSDSGVSTPKAAASTTRPMDRKRFCSGLVLTCLGVAALLLIAVGQIHRSVLTDRLPLPVLAGLAVLGIMCLGGGFGLMTVSAGGLDDGEFERLMEAGNTRSTDDSAESSPADG